ISLFGQQLSQGAGAPAELPPLARLELDVVDQSAERNVSDRQRIARQDVGLRTRHDRVAGLEAERRDDVALLSVSVVQQRNARRSIRVVFDPGHGGRNPELLAAEIDLPQHPPSTATPMTNRNAARGVATAAPALGREKPLLRASLGDLFVGDE